MSRSLLNCWKSSDEARPLLLNRLNLNDGNIDLEAPRQADPGAVWPRSALGRVLSAITSSAVGRWAVSKPWYYWPLQTVNGVYAVLVSFLFGALAYHRGKTEREKTLNFISSLIVNLPMSAVFSHKFIDKMTRCWRTGPWKPEKDIIFFMITLVSMVIAAFTIAAGWELGRDAVSNASEDVIIKAFKMDDMMPIVGPFVYAFNTLTTRVAGGMDLLERMFRSGSEFLYYGPLYPNLMRMVQFLRQYGESADIKIPVRISAVEAENQPAHNNVVQLKEQISIFLQILKERLLSGTDSMNAVRQAIIQNSQWRVRLKYVALLVSAGLAIYSFSLFPMWIGLSQDGWRALHSKDIAKSTLGVVFSALSNQIFYASGAFFFVERVFDFSKKLFGRMCNADIKQGLAYGSLFAFALGMMVLSWFSGGGMAAAMVKQQSKARPFDDAANNSYLFHLTRLAGGTHSDALPYIAQFYAGLLLNGSGFLLFILNHFMKEKTVAIDVQRNYQNVLEELTTLLKGRNSAGHLLEGPELAIQRLEFEQDYKGSVAELQQEEERVSWWHQGKERAQAWGGQFAHFTAGLWGNNCSCSRSGERQPLLG